MSEESTASPASEGASTDTSNEGSWSEESNEADDDLFDDVKEARKEEAAKKPDPKPKAEAKEEAPKPAKRFVTANINGKEVRVDEETLLREYQKSRAGDERLQKASALEKQMQQFVKQLQENPAAILSDPRLGINKQALAEAILREQIESELEDPKDREAKTLKAQLQKYQDREETEKRTHKEQADKAERQEAVSKAQARLQDTFEKAMEQSVLSKSPATAAATLRDMALYYRMAKQQGHEVTPEELSSHVEQKQLSTLHAAANSLSGEELISFLGEAVIKKMRAADLARLEQRSGKPSTQANESWAPRNEKPKEQKFIDPRDLRDEIRRKF